MVRIDSLQVCFVIIMLKWFGFVILGTQDFEVALVDLLLSFQHKGVLFEPRSGKPVLQFVQLHERSVLVQAVLSH